MEPEKLAELFAELKDLNHLEILDSLEMSVNIEIILDGERMRWVTMQAKPEVVAAFVKGVVPAMEQISSVMRAGVKIAKAQP